MRTSRKAKDAAAEKQSYACDTFTGHGKAHQPSLPGAPVRVFPVMLLGKADEGAAIDLVLKAHEPNPALAVDRHWNLVSANRMVAPLLDGIPERLLGQPFNVLRLCFHPEALAARTVNLAEWCSHLLERLHRQCEATADPELIKLYQDLKAFPIPARSTPLSSDSVAIPFKLRHDGDTLSFFSTTMVFGTPVDITLSELALETFFPADELTADRMRKMAAQLK